MYPTRTNRALPARRDHVEDQLDELMEIDDSEAGLSSIDAVVLCAVIVVIIAAGVATLQPRIAAAFQTIADTLP